MSPVKIAVVGVGGWGKNLIRVFSELEECELFAVCDADEGRSKNFGKTYGIPSFTDFSSMLRGVELDAVAVATPSSTHFKIAMQAIREDKHTFVEKPICSSPVEAKILVGEAERRGVKLMVGQIERYNPVTQELKKLIEQGKAGKVYSLSSRRAGRPVKVNEIGVIKDLAIHDIDAMRYLLGKDPKSVFANCLFVENERFEDLAEIIMIFEDKVIGYIEANRLPFKKERSILVTGEVASVAADYLNKKLTVTYASGEEEIPIVAREPLKVELLHFIDCISRNRVPLTSGFEGMRSLEVAEAALKAAEASRSLPIDYL